jgi:hypothetical protein
MNKKTGELNTMGILIMNSANKCQTASHPERRHYFDLRRAVESVYRSRAASGSVAVCLSRVAQFAYSVSPSQATAS